MLFAGSVSAQWVTNANGIHYNSGNVGIGTSLPTEMLHLYNPEAKAEVLIEGIPGSSYINPIARTVFSDISQGNLFVNVLREKSGNFEFIQSAYVAGTSSWEEFVYFNYTTLKYEMRHGGDAEFLNGGNVLFNNSGGVLINTSYIPSGYHLAVGGKIIAEEVLVELQTAWPDYVFKTDYKLPSISELDAFIKENSHLPGVPSQKEVSENGISLGEMNGILLEKIEELTLYIIQQDERIKKLEELISK
jgi:hypothetical protein